MNSSPTDRLSRLYFDYMDSSPELTERYARRKLIDIILSFNDIVLPENWTKFSLGKVEWAFAVGTQHPLARKKIVSNFEGFRLLGQAHIESDQLFSRPSPYLQLSGASDGARVENTRYAIKLLEDQKSIAYLPLLTLKPALNAGVLKVINLAGFQVQQSRPLMIHAEIDKVSSGELKDLIRVLSIK